VLWARRVLVVYFENKLSTFSKEAINPLKINSFVSFQIFQVAREMTSIKLGPSKLLEARAT
jgi:hypothetical protein